MIRCCFIGEDALYDHDLDKKLAIELEKLVQLDEEIEFWFFTPDSYAFHTHAYHRLCLFLTIWLRTKYPHKSIKIVQLIYTSTQEILEYNSEIDYALPRALVDKSICFPVNEAITKHCNYVFSYDYPSLNKKPTKTSKGIQKGTPIIQLANPETADLIQEIMALLSEQDQLILQMTKDKKKQIDIAQAAGISKYSIRHETNDVYRRLQRRARNITSMDCHASQSICALMCLGNPLATSTQLLLFESVIDYLIRKNVSEFWIDEDSLRTSYGVILARFLNKEGWTLTALKIYPSSLSDYKEAIKQSQWVLTDYTHEQAETIKTLCSEDGRTLLVDIGSDKRRVEKMPS